MEERSIFVENIQSFSDRVWMDLTGKYFDG
jgi:hypothetical protein